jgi:cytochrome c oxidase assembly protein subunit 15
MHPSPPVRVKGPNRHLRNFTLATFSVAVALLSWGAFVTSIDAGMAVPDWPTSFDSYDPFNPWPGWWTVTPVLAEHGHRLLGALVGFMTLVLALWTWRSESRAWMRRSGFGALALVVLQGLLGGLRVLWVSLDLAVVHACVAQLFFALLASMALFQTESWSRPRRLPSQITASKGHILWIAPVAVYVQIIFGALLRHPGTGIDTTLVAAHLGWAFVATAMIVALVVRIRTTLPAGGLLGKLSAGVIAILTLQVALGLIAYFVLLDETGRIQPSNVQVLANTAHMVIGALLFACTVVLAVLATRARSFSVQPTA